MQTNTIASMIGRIKDTRVTMWLFCLVCISLIALSWVALAQLEKSGDIYSSRRPYPPYLYIGDFPQFYSLGQIAASSDRFQIYDPATQDRYLNAILSPNHTTKMYYNFNLPWLFVLMIPFSWLPFRLSYLVFCILCVVFGSTGLALVAKKIRSMTWLQTACLVLAANASVPAWLALEHGNTSYYLVGYASIYFWAMTKRRDFIAGIAFAFLFQKPQYVLPLAFPALRFGRWKLLFTAAFCELALLALAAFVIGPANVISYPFTLFQHDTTQDYDGCYPLQMVSVRAIYAAVFSEAACMPLSWGTFFVGAGCLGYLWMKVKPDNEIQIRWAMAVTISAMLVMSPHTYPYDLLYLALAAALTLPKSMSEFKLQPIFAKLWTTMLIVSPVATWGFYLTENGMGFQHKLLSIFSVCLLVTVAAAYRQQFSGRGTPRASTVSPTT